MMWSKGVIAILSFIHSSPLPPSIFTSNQGECVGPLYLHDEESSSTQYLLPTSSRRKMIATSAILASLPIITKSSPSIAISSEEAEASYDSYASKYDQLDGGSVADSLGIEEARFKMLNMARGRVLEIGVGTGLNLGKYKFASASSATTSTDNTSDGVTSLTLLDISEGMMSEARAKLAALDIPSHVEVNFVKADATKDLSALFGTDGSFDTVVDTFSLCVMGNAGARECLAQMRDVIKKDTGRILLIENTRSSNGFLGAYQDLTAGASAKLGGKGCISNQDVTSYIQQTKGLQLLSEEEFAAGVFRSFVCKRF